MRVDQLPDEVREFTGRLHGLLARLNPDDGWCAVFWRRDPDGMRACLEGREVPPWDVVHALLQDLAVAYGTDATAHEADRVRVLHAAALAAHDALPGGRDALVARLDAMLRRREYAAERLARLSRSLTESATPEQSEAHRVDLAWAQDDHERATARCAELRSRMAESDRRGEGIERSVDGGGRTTGDPPPTAPVDEPARRQTTDAVAAHDVHGTHDAHDVHGTPHGHDTPAAPVGTPAAKRKRRRGGARFAGAPEGGDVAPAVVPQTPAPDPGRQSAARRTPRGARFAGAAEEVPRPRPEASRTDGAGTAGQAPGPSAAEAVAEAARALELLRGEGRGGEAHALLTEIAHWSAGCFPLLAARLRPADWATLLWEAASLPAGHLVAAADALTAAGRGADGEQMLRQGVVRPADHVGAAVLGFADEGRTREMRALLDAYVRVRPPEEAARSAAPDPRRLVPLLLEAARGVSDAHHWDLLHALRVAGFAV
ncbi:hypothetical protein [Streptomyces sp. NPDC086787]|uniref:hypothetical protein n=1 Tax=Streptomyces sp. NPDC086787 TaxID=3365759 RepID=UPI0038010531